MKPLTYNPNKPFYVDRAIAKAEKRLEEMNLRREIWRIEQKLKHLAAFALSSPPKAST